MGGQYINEKYLREFIAQYKAEVRLQVGVLEFVNIIMGKIWNQYFSVQIIFI